MDVIGHRGAAGEAPENTLAAIERGLAAGSAGIEIDVRLADGLVLVFHDATLDRTTDATGLVYVRSADELRALAPQVVTLEPVAAVCAAAGRQLNVECKDVAVVGPALARRPPGADWLVSSFLEPALVRSRELAPEVPRALLANDAEPATLERALALGCANLHLPCAVIDAEVAGRVHAVGLILQAFTCNDEPEFARLRSAGCDAAITDYPTRFVRA